LTYEKTQSKSFPKLILDLQLWPKLSLTAEKVLVGLSRSQRMDDLRILPFSAGQTEEHLFKLKPNVAMLNWLSGFNSDGKWCPELTKESIKKYPLQKSKQSILKSKQSIKLRNPQIQKMTHQQTKTVQQKRKKQIQMLQPNPKTVGEGKPNPHQKQGGKLLHPHFQDMLFHNFS
jgi:hypothetical protein